MRKHGEQFVAPGGVFVERPVERARDDLQRRLQEPEQAVLLFPIEQSASGSFALEVSWSSVRVRAEGQRVPDRLVGVVLKLRQEALFVGGGGCGP